MLSTIAPDANWRGPNYGRPKVGQTKRRPSRCKRREDEARRNWQQDTPVAEIKCHELVVKHNTIDHELRCIADCLVHLSQEHQVLDQCDRDQGRMNTATAAATSTPTTTTNCSPIVRTEKDDRVRVTAHFDQANRIRSVLSIYSTILQLAPIEAHLKGGQSVIEFLNKTTTTTTNFCPLEARQRVLDLIENRLPGYCDSIHLLRCILKSSHMIGAIAAFGAIVNKIVAYNSTKLQEDLESMDAFNGLDEGQCEFRIVQEWKV